jgi:hypothetical protein
MSIMNNTRKLHREDAARSQPLPSCRLDMIGMKFQLSDEMRSAFTEAYARRADANHETEPRAPLYSVTSSNGRFQDLRNQYSLLKNFIARPG